MWMLLILLKVIGNLDITEEKRPEEKLLTLQAEVPLVS
jgi:hypothetical protein